MTVQSWRTLRAQKYQLTFRLFLFLNLVSSTLSVFSPIYDVNIFPLPAMLIAVGSCVLLVWNWRYASIRPNLPIISAVFGCLWGWHILSKTLVLALPNDNFQMIALFSVIFVGTIAFSNNIVAFTLHSLPTFIVCLITSPTNEWWRMAYCIALPLIGIAIQHVIQRRNDKFAQGLMYKLLEERETLNGLSMLDPLTGLYNRRGFQFRLDSLMSIGEARHSVLLLDIDHFKAYNDHYGHMMGDQALMRVSAAIRNAVRSRDIVTRFGGEEFMVVLPHCDVDTAMQTAERIRQQVYDLRIPHMFNASVATHVTISIGVAPLEDSNIELAMQRADKALYEAKNMGRNNILTYEQAPAV
ncbi:TPA: GGDEF domain-containing protein [Kluyvera ascorbata]|nr:GGDEF domain-containing protein [Kluyvera ascorbata]